MQIPFRSFDLNIMKFGSVRLRNFSLKTATVPPPFTTFKIINIVGNMAKEWISKRVFQEKQSTPNFMKNVHLWHSYPWYVHVRMRIRG